MKWNTSLYHSSCAWWPYARGYKYRRASWRKTLINLPANVCRCLSHNWDLVFELTLQGGIMSCGASCCCIRHVSSIHPQARLIRIQGTDVHPRNPHSFFVRYVFTVFPQHFRLRYCRSSSSLSYLSHEFPLMFSDVFHGGESNRALLYVVGGRLVWNIQPVN